MSVEGYVTLKSLSEQLSLDRSNTRKYVLKLGIKPQRRRTPDSGNQLTLTVTEEEARTIIHRRAEQGFLAHGKIVSADTGHFYIIQLVPELDPHRIKLGFAADVAERLAQHRTAAPTARLLRAWPCKRTWELTAMDALTGEGCRFILNEVFEVDDLEAIAKRGDAFFALLPDPQTRPLLSNHSPYQSA